MIVPGRLSRLSATGALFLVCMCFLPVTLADTKGSAEVSDASIQSRARQLLSGYNVGYRILTMPDGKKLAVWYPCDSVEKKHQYRVGGKEIETGLAVDAECLEGKFPVVFYAHGAVGCGLSSFFLTEALARKGYIVAAPDFSDPVYVSRIDEIVPQSEEKKKAVWKFIHSLRDEGLNIEAGLGRKKYSFRPRQLAGAIEYFIGLDKRKNSPFYSRLDPGKVAIVGHSFGAWTALLVAGADPEFSSFVKIAGVVALSGPANDRVFKVVSENDLAKIKCPVMFQYGASEKIFSERQDDEVLYQKSNSPKVLACISNCTHFDFSWGSGKNFSNAEDFLLKSQPRVVISDLTIAFLDKYLKGKAISSCLKEKTVGVELLKADLN